MDLEVRVEPVEVAVLLRVVVLVTHHVVHVVDLAGDLVLLP